MANVVIKKAMQAYNIDAYNRTAVCEKDIDNGCVFKLEEYSKTPGEGEVWTAVEPASGKGLWMATSPEVVITKGADGNVYRGLTPDPRAFTNVAGHMIDATFLAVGDIVEMTCDGVGNTSVTSLEEATHLVPDAHGFALKTALSAGEGAALKKIGKGHLHIGTGALAGGVVPTYKFIVEAN